MNRIDSKKGTEMICISIDMDKTGANIRRLLKENGYSIGEIMAITGVSTPQAVYKWFGGKSLPSIENLLVLSELLEINIRNILITK